MEIRSLSVERTGETTETIIAAVGGSEIRYEISGSPVGLRRSYDPFLLSAFAPAMQSGEVIDVSGDAPVSERLTSNLQAAMAIYYQWFPELSEVVIRPGEVEDNPTEGTDHVGCFFSGGVDSFYTFIQNEPEITHLILCQGLDIPLDEPERWQRTVELVGEFAESRNKGLILVKTNVRDHLQILPLAQRGADNHGAILVSTGLALGFRKLFVPASLALDELLPWGSHVLLDHLFSNGLTEVVHDSPVQRSKKLEAIAETKIGLNILRVCSVYSEYNCGKCEKCLRTRMVLTLLGAESASLEPLKHPSELRSLKLYEDSQRNCWVANLAFATKMGRDDYRREIERILRRYRTRKSIQQLDQDVFGGVVTRLKLALKSS